MSAIAMCSICMDNSVHITFECGTLDCGANSRNCPMCKESAGIKMVVALAGKGAIHLVEHKLCATVEYNIKSNYLKKKEDKKELETLSTQAHKIFHELTEDLMMKCPRFTFAFYDYNGCHALCYSQVSCNAAFCAICLKDCGLDAHMLFSRVRGAHCLTSLHLTFQRYLDQLHNMCFELKQMVQNQIEHAKLGETTGANKMQLTTTLK